MNPRARAEIKTLANVAKEVTDASNDGDPAALFMAGLLSGLAIAVKIDEGSTAEQQLEDLDNRLAAAVGRAYLAGAIKPAGDSGPDIAEAAADDRRWPLEKAGE
jgi:hypothetical protein